jgi:hypothetical protein
VTWFRFGFPEAIELVLRDGSSRTLAFEGAGLPRELGEAPGEVERLVVKLSNEALLKFTLIDTPGLASATAGRSSGTEDMLAMTEASRRAASQVDALVFVINQSARQDDAEAVAAFGEMVGTATASPSSAIGVLGKADKIGGRDTSQAAAIADRCAEALQSRLGKVIPLVALLAETAQCGMLNEHDARAVAALAAEDRKRMAATVRSVDLFRKLAPIPAADTERLLTLLDLYGIEQAVEFVASNGAGAGPLSEELARLSGIASLTAVLDETFGRNADVLKARTALSDLEQLSWRDLDGASKAELARFRDRIEELRLEPEMHRIREVLALQRCADGVQLPQELLADAVRLTQETMTADKLGLPESASPEDLRAAALAGAQRWNAFKNDARLDQAAIADVFSRSYALVWGDLQESAASLSP